MRSRTKNHQPTSVIEAMIDRAFGAREVPTKPGAISEVDRGWFNAVYRVRLRSGHRTMLKIAPAQGVPVLSYERDLMRNELAALALLADRAVVPVPVVEFADATADLIDAPWFFMTALPGESLADAIEQATVTPPEAARLLEQLGKTNRALNGITGTRFGSIARGSERSWSDAFRGMLSDLVDDGRRAGLAMDEIEERLRAVLAHQSDELDEVTTPRFVAWDLWPANTIVRRGRITGVVDHERALWGDPLMEAGFLGDNVPIYGGREHFLRGYGRGPLSESERTRRRLYSIHLLLVMMIEPLYRGVQDPKQAAWSRERLRVLLTRLAQ